MPTEAAPHLEFKELLRSKEAIKNLVVVQPWHEYTLMLQDKGPSIGYGLVVLNERGENVLSEEAAVMIAKINYYSAIFNNKTDATLVLTGGIPGSLRMPLSDVPRHLQPAALSEFRRGKITAMQAQYCNQWTSKMVKSSFAHLMDGGKYVVFPDSTTGFFIAFQTENEQGSVLAPKNWKRIETRTPEAEVPKELGERVFELCTRADEYRELNGTYDALVTDTGVGLVRTADDQKKVIFRDLTPSVGKNIRPDPSDPRVVYYCAETAPDKVARLDTSGDPAQWKVEFAPFPKKYADVKNLQLDPSGNFFLFESGGNLVVVAKDTLEEAGSMPGLKNVNFDSRGRIRGINKEGYLVVLDANFADLARDLNRRRLERVAQGVALADLFKPEARGSAGGKENETLKPMLARYAAEFRIQLAAAADFEGLRDIRNVLKALGGRLRRDGLRPAEAAYIIDGLEPLIASREKEIASERAEAVLGRMAAILGGSPSAAELSEARAELAALQAYESTLDSALRVRLHDAANEVTSRGAELFRREGGRIIAEVRATLDRVKSELEGFTRKGQFDDWLEFRLPQLKSKLASLARDCPLEAEEAFVGITAARSDLQQLADQFEHKFKVEYEAVREKAADRREALVENLEQDVEGIVGRLRGKGFRDRAAAEQYLSGSEAKRALEGEISALGSDDPDAAKTLDRTLKSRIANALAEVERGAKVSVAETGQQMVYFGGVPFPRFEGEVKKKQERRVELTFVADPHTKGPGVSPNDVRGDVTLAVSGSDGVAHRMRLFQDWPDEDEWRLGLLTYRGKEIPPSYVTAGEFKELKRDYADWQKGDKSALRAEFQRLRDALKELYARRPKRRGGSAEDELKWQQDFKTTLASYAEFCRTHRIVLIRRMDQVRREPNLETANGKGHVPTWQNHWVVDPQTELDLAEMARAFKMQSDLQEGMVNLKGHAGTGKDVRLKMFATLTRRPLFPTDCTKWTTEFELSEDVVLEAKNGASQTVRIPSSLLTGIRTPGAIVYLNEWNAMPEQAQIFLHSLMDEKRELTLKTSGGSVIKAHPSVIIAGSMNPNYPGTFAPQFATRSRVVDIEIDYTPLHRPNDPGDANPNPAYDPSEALRVARETDSLADLTFEENMERNEFVQLWDSTINGMDNGAPPPTEEQRFDLEVILALTQFAHRLRGEFIKIFEKTREARNALPVKQPITGRELRRAAYALSAMSAPEKAAANPEAVARDLLRFFFRHIDSAEDRGKIITAMATWTSAKRVAA